MATSLDATVLLPPPLVWIVTQSPVSVGASPEVCPFCVAWMTQVWSCESFFVSLRGTRVIYECVWPTHRMLCQKKAR